MHFRSSGGMIHVMSVIDRDPPISANTEPGDFTVLCRRAKCWSRSSSPGEKSRLMDEQIAAHKDIEWYRLFLVPGKPDFERRLVDCP
jgi:hypothetical protein